MLLSSPLTALVLFAVGSLPIVSANILPESPLIRRQSPHPEHDNQPYNIRYWATVEFHNNCPAGTTIAVYRGDYLFTLNSVHSNPRQATTSRLLYDDNDITVFAMINQGNFGGPDPLPQRYLWTSFFMDNYWFVKYPNSTVKDIPVSVSPNKPPNGDKCPKVVCNSQSCTANTEHPPGRKRSTSEVRDEVAAIQLAQDDVYWTCPDTWKYTVTYCPDGKL